MKSTPTKLLILILALAVIIAIGAGSFALAYWSGSPELDIEQDDSATIDNDDDATFKYLIFAPISDLTTDYCFEYTDATGWVLKYEYGNDYVINGGAHKAGARVEASASAADKTAIKTNGVRVIGYIGTLGQYEDLIIPSTISWDGANVEVKKINIKMTEYKESMDLITGVIIPSSITHIDGASFSGAGNLIKVKFLGTLPVISSYAFVGMNANIHYYDSTNTEINNIRA